MPIVKDVAQGVDLNRLAQAAAQELGRQSEALRRAEPEKRAEYDTVYVIESVVDPEPRLRWDVVSGLPHDIAPFGVSASLGEATRNRESLASLLERRMRRGFRGRLEALKLMPVDDAMRRSTRLRVIVAESQ